MNGIVFLFSYFLKVFILYLVEGKLEFGYILRICDNRKCFFNLKKKEILFVYIFVEICDKSVIIYENNYR